MTIRHLKILIAVCENGSITKAAEMLHIAQPAVSCTIAEIERYYKVVLFDRINQRLVITDAGKNLLLKAREVIASFDDFENVARQGSKRPTIRIGSSLTIGKTIVPAYVQKIREQYPEVKLSVMIHNTSVIERELEQGNLDFGFVEGQVLSSRIHAVPFGSDRLAAVCAADYAIPEKVALSELSSHNLLFREKGSASRELIDNIFSIHRLTVSPMMESVSNEAILAAAAAGLGIAILPEGLICSYLASDQLKKIEIDGVNFGREYYMISHKNKKFSPLQRQIYDLFRAVFSEKNDRYASA